MIIVLFYPFKNMGIEKSSAGAMIDAAKAERQKKVKGEAVAALAKNKEIEESSYSDKSEQQVAQKLRNVEQLRNEVAELEEFVNDDANKAVVESSDIRKRLDEKKRYLSHDEENLARGNLSTSIEGLEPDVREEMAVQYTKGRYEKETRPVYNPDYRLAQLKDKVMSDMASHKTIDDDVTTLVASLQAQEIGDKNRQRIFKEWSEEVTENITKTKEDPGDLRYGRRTREWGYGQQPEAKDRARFFEADHTAWKNFYDSLARTAGLPDSSGRTDQDIQVPDGYPISMNLFTTGGDTVGLLKTHAGYNKKSLNEHEFLQSRLEAAKQAKGFLGIGTLKKKLKLLDIQFPRDSELKYSQLDTMSVAGLDASIDMLLEMVAQKIPPKQTSEKVFEQAIAGAPQIMKVLARTPLNLMWRVELQQHALEKLAEAA